jgi:glycosyltransferase involved in cell wall biosynthesis
MIKNCIWITWEKQRRTDSLSEELRVQLFRLTPHRNYLIKTIFLSIKTIFILSKHNPRILIVQNPSMFLTGLVCFLMPIFNYKLVVDRHSNFKFHTSTNKSLKYRAFHWVSRFTVQKANLTIVTNQYLADIVSKWGGNPFVLQDKLPSLCLAKNTVLEGSNNLVLVSSFSDDEPIDEILNASLLLDKDTVLYITGNWNTLSKKWLNNLPPQVRLTGYLAEKEFQSLLYSVDAIIALTTQENTLLCSAYEAISLQKPLITSDTEELKSYFRTGVIFTDHSTNSIIRNINYVISNKNEITNEIGELGNILTKEWQPKFLKLVSLINKL